MASRPFDALWSRLPPSYQPLDAPERLPRGFSGMEGWRWTSPSGVVICKGHLTVRLPPARLRWQHALRNHWRRHECLSVPEPLHDVDDRSLMLRGERVWEWQPAVAGSGRWSTGPTTELVARVICELATLHKVAKEFLPPDVPRWITPAPCVSIRIQRIAEYRALCASSEFAGLHRCEDLELRQLTRRALEWFRRDASACEVRLHRLADQPVEQGPCLRDVRPGDVFFADGVFQGFVDTAAADIDFPLTDVARFVGELPAGTIDWSQALDAYAAVAPIPPNSEEFCETLAIATRMISSMHWVREVVAGATAERLEMARIRLQHLLR